MMIYLTELYTIIASPVIQSNHNDMNRAATDRGCMFIIHARCERTELHLSQMNASNRCNNDVKPHFQKSPSLLEI